MTDTAAENELVERDIRGGRNLPPEPADERKARDPKYLGRHEAEGDAPEDVATTDATEDAPEDATGDAPEDATGDVEGGAPEDATGDVEGGAAGGSDDPSDAETFPREYVEKLRKEAADARVKAKRADDLAARLHTALVAATGRLADPSDLPFDDAHLEDADALNAAVDELLARKPHLASRRPVGSIGQGATSPADSVSLAGILRHNAF